MKSSRLISAVLMVAAALAAASCSRQKFHIQGTIAGAQDSVLYLENAGLDGPVIVDSVKLDKEGRFAFDEPALDTITPEFYRLRIASQVINLSIDSTETVTVSATYPGMATDYEVKGSDNCSKIRELALMQQQLQARVDAVVGSPRLGIDSVAVVVGRLLDAYKNQVKRAYIFPAPMKAYAYYALFQTVRVGHAERLIFDPRANADDVKVFAAVATSWDVYYPGAERGKNLHNIALEGMKNVRIIMNRQAQRIDPAKIDMSGVINIALRDNKGVVRQLTDLKGQVVLLDFHVFASEGSPKRIMMLRDLYNKYHDRGFTIYQVSLDPDEHFWLTQTEALPWISVRDEDGLESENLVRYNVQTIPTFFLIDKNNVLQKRDVQVRNLDAEIQSML